MLAKNFLKATCGSVSGYDSDQTADTYSDAKFTASSTNIAEEGEDSMFFESSSPTRCSPKSSQPVTPSSVSVKYLKGITTPKTVDRTANIEEKSPQNSNGVVVLPRASSLPSFFHSNAPDQFGNRSNYPGMLDKHQQRSHSCLNLNSTHWNSIAGLIISSPVYRPTEPVPSSETKLRRVNAIKRRPLLDSGITQLTTDVSSAPNLF